MNRCLPGAIGMYGLSLGVSRIGNNLPHAVYALLSGLNAATVGIIALAAIRLAERAITDKLTRLMVYLGGALGMLYAALWYYPVIMAGAGLSTLAWDMGYVHTVVNFGARVGSKLALCRSIRHSDVERADCKKGSYSGNQKPLKPPSPAYTKYQDEDKPIPETKCRIRPPISRYAYPSSLARKYAARPLGTSVSSFPKMSWQLGLLILTTFVVTFILTTALHALLPSPSRLSSLFASLYLAGTIIFGGGPVVIPLLREYMIAPGWVSSRDFLLGLAVIQAFPGPNFNFAVYLGSLAVAGTKFPSFVGAFVAFLGMYVPGLFVVVGFMGLWRMLKEKKWFLAVLRGVNAAAVGLVFSAVYKLWQIGYLTASGQGGSPLGGDPWLVAITGTAFVGGAWFGFSPPVAILLGGAMGVGRYGAVGG
ncbi:MAG: hypothetical protein Q9190_007534 [Brigantiaea leucoxantha]